ETGKCKPFFLWLHYMDIHEPYVPERKYIDVVDSSIGLDEEEMFRLFNDVVLNRDVSDKRVVEILKKLYHAHVRQVDDVVRELFGILEEKGVLRHCVVIIASDHGDEFGEHGGISHDGKMYSELINVPLMIYEPEREEGLVCHTLVSTLDIPPTIAHLFGLDPVERFKGCSLLPLEEYPEKGVFGEAFDKHGSFETGEEKEVHYYREGDLKIIYREREDSWELFDLESDPEETKNIAEISPFAEAMKEKVRPRVRRYQG
ncbi:MAG: sulfatase-like hydrolase/transferase, partial [Proteobacteria bacterium]|nr:sulfatase-like hydrolase/transferase [Pseudomonadota bacterium]NIS69793.1 sulfatase-like hydrolase/transferase [Pseudomonadota bacterium]